MARFEERKDKQYNRMKYYYALKGDLKKDATREINQSIKYIASDEVMQMKYIDILSRRFEDGQFLKMQDDNFL